MTVLETIKKLVVLHCTFLLFCDKIILRMLWRYFSIHFRHLGTFFSIAFKHYWLSLSQVPEF